jgi:hypothetical protein
MPNADIGPVLRWRLPRVSVALRRVGLDGEKLTHKFSDCLIRRCLLIQIKDCVAYLCTVSIGGRGDAALPGLPSGLPPPRYIRG